MGQRIDNISTCKSCSFWWKRLRKLFHQHQRLLIVFKGDIHLRWSKFIHTHTHSSFFHQAKTTRRAKLILDIFRTKIENSLIHMMAMLTLIQWENLASHTVNKHNCWAGNKAEYVTNTISRVRITMFELSSHSYLLWSEWLNLSEAQTPHLLDEGNNNTCREVIRIKWDNIYKQHFTQCLAYRKYLLNGSDYPYFN